MPVKKHGNADAPGQFKSQLQKTFEDLFFCLMFSMLLVLFLSIPGKRNNSNSKLPAYNKSIQELAKVSTKEI